MYWPIGAPRVYAASQHQLDTSRNRRKSSTQLSDDGAPKARRRSSTLALDSDEKESILGAKIIGVRLSRNGNLFVTITQSTLTLWQTKPTTVVASVLRSSNSLKTYGENVDVLLRPDTAIIVIQTALGYLITYSLSTDSQARLYQPILPEHHPQNRRKSIIGNVASVDPFAGPGEAQGIREFTIKFRMVIKVDAGVSKAIALDDELIVATEMPPAIQCVRWIPNEKGSQATTALLKSMSWISKSTHIKEIIHDRPMNLSVWITSDGKGYAVQKPQSANPSEPSDLFQGHCFHDPESDDSRATKAAISARFSLIAVSCVDSDILVYTARDYAGHIPLSHKLSLPVSRTSAGAVTCLSYSPDGYALFVGYEKGWAIWSVYGKLGACSFASDKKISTSADESWLLGVKEAFWIGSGSQLIMLSPNDNRLWALDMARSAVTGCFSSANVARSLLQTPTGFMIYRGYDLPDLGTVSLESGLWHQVQIPTEYIHRQWPIRSSVISADGRYVAVAGRRGLAHYSVTSGRWKTFDDTSSENDFTVRGGMCWHQHVLIAAVESGEGFQIRVYSRESALDNAMIMHIQQLPAPIVHLAPSGQDSLLVYTYDNLLYHYIITVSNAAVNLVQVGEIQLHGIIRAPLRVRALSWILPEDQLENGDPSHDVEIATILFLVDGKLVVLQPSYQENKELKYDMRIIAQNAEYYVLMRDQQYFNSLNQKVLPKLSENESEESSEISKYHQNDLRDSLWYFDGHDMQVWTDAQELLASAPPELGRELPVPIRISTDFYPLSVLLSKAILFGIEPDMLQRRDMGFSVLRFTTRTQLFLPQILRHHLSQYNAPSALYVSQNYSHLEYFAHALEVLLHDVLDDEVDSPPAHPEQALLPSVISLISSFDQYLDIIVQCTRKTEARSWQTLFAHLPPPKQLFDESLANGNLKTAGGYLLVLHTFEEMQAEDEGLSERAGEEQMLELLQRAKDVQDWELCKELARFLMAMDDSGTTLKRTLSKAGFSIAVGE
ncbi:RIC1-domain-containing protein [Microthyrium microscopicum]|uniref:RIC1-domain-containing protein n=1 Tax=Microthyrium microscopicum TaxID=703497 RepID=A0A6A6U8W2_9PEZI|nr:RIC1-domain-containing protein [Microthyrium microscopicum]